MTSEGELHAALGLHRGRRWLIAIGLALGVVAVLSVVPGEREPLVPPTPVIEVGRTASPPSQPPRPVRRRRALIATKPAPMIVAELPARPAVTPVPAAVVDEPPAAPPEVAVEEVESAPPAPPAEEPVSDGNCERIARAIAAEKRSAVRTCFEHELKEQPKLSGTVIVELSLAPPARVEAVRVSDDLNRPTFTRCVTAAMQSVRFATLDEEISVSVPYVLRPERK